MAVPPWSIALRHVCFEADTQTWNNETTQFVVLVLLRLEFGKALTQVWIEIVVIVQVQGELFISH